MEIHLRKKRQACGITQQDLADRVGVTRQTIGLIEAGKYNPSIKICLMLARETKCKVDEIFSYKDMENTK